MIAWFALLPLVALPAPEAKSGPSATEGQARFPATVDTDGGTFRLALKPLHARGRAPVPFNELFELQVDVTQLRQLDDPNPLWLDLQATMPGHGHGMNTHARVDGPDGKRFIIRGLLLHMAGEWEFSFDIAKGRLHEKAKVRFVLE